MQYGNYGDDGYGRGGQGGNPYGQQPQRGYGQQQSGGGSYGRSENYGGRQDYEPNLGSGQQGYGNDVEMAPLNGQSGNQGQSTGQDPNAILNACREIDRGLDAIDDKLEQVKRLQQQSLSSADASGNTGLNRDLENASNGTMDLYRNLGARIKQIKSQPESGSPKNAPQVGRVDRRLKAAINKYQTLDRDYRRQLQAAFERQYRIVRPDASDAEVREAVEDTSNNQIFSQALLQSDRRGQAQTTIQNVKNRHEAIQKIERDMIELAQLFQDMEALVVQQEPAVAQIEQKGEQVTEDVGRANTEISGAIEKARSRNRKKWWCLLIVLLIIIVIVVVAVVVTLVNKNKK